MALAEDATETLPETPVAREVSPGVYEIGTLRLDQKTRTVRFPAVLNMHEGHIEYLLVTNKGSIHESLLTCDVPTQDLHFAMLLLGAKGSRLEIPEPRDLPTGQIDAKYLQTAPKLRGDPLAITVAWKTDDAEKTAPVEDWIFNTETAKPMSRGPWIYNGSLFHRGHFMAQLEGAFAAVVTFPSALINNPRTGNNNDQIWKVNTEAVPAVKTALILSIQILPDPELPSAP